LKFLKTTIFFSIDPALQSDFPVYSENLKRNLKKGNTDPLTTLQITKKSSPCSEQQSKNIKNLDDQSYKMFSRLIYQARKYNMAEISALYDSTNTLTAGAVFLIAMGRAVMIFSAVSDSGRSINAMHRIIDHFIQQHSQQNLILDFEGSNDEQLARFYKSFGATNSPYLRIRHNKIPLPTSLIDVLRGA
jgi:lipid II:glycine glycyltransferase (peptidoglycan interpeptide bridge formation enzyme)